MEKTGNSSKIPYITLGLLLLLLLVFAFGKNKEAELVSGFPQVPIYPSATLISSFVEEVEVIKTPVYDAVWSSDKSVPEIAGWYRQSLTNDGWTIHVPAGDQNQDVQFMAFKKDPNVFHLSLVKNDAGGTIITIDVYHYLYKLIYEEENT